MVGSVGILVCLVALVSVATEAKVLELSDRFLPLRQEGMWLVKVTAT